ncbi:MAG: von Willebrand factor type A domain-containing protein, partial [Elusimicrobia bacterium]|nr:von Willebrand factor type A domain-containing protein [Elusimicrobiota bacterium]
MKRRPLPGLLALSLLLFIAACRTTTRPEPPVSQTQTSAPANDPSVAPEPDTIARIVNPPVVHEAAAREPQPVAERREVEAGRALAAKKAASVAYDMAAGAAAYPAAPACSYNMMAFGSGGAPQPAFNTEDYKAINDNVFHAVKDAPLSTFSVDVDAASYSNLRRFIQQNQRPPKDAVRIEEMV